LLGVSINLSKSIVSPSKPVFEFAKRTCIGDTNVSPIPFPQLLSNTLADRIGSFLLYSQRGLFQSISSILTSLARSGNSHIKYLPDVRLPVLATLGTYVTKNIIPHRWLVESLVDPDDDEFEFDSVRNLKVPIMRSCKLIQEIITKVIPRGDNLINDENHSLSYPFSNEETRKEIYDDYEPEFANVVANAALAKAKALERDYDELIARQALCIINKPKVWDDEKKILKSQIIG